MDTCTAIAAYATETGYLIRGLLVVVALGMVFAWRQGRKLRKTGLALQDSRRFASAAQQRVRELEARALKLEKIGSAFEVELKRVDGERRHFKFALREKQRQLENSEDRAGALQELIQHVVM